MATVTVSASSSGGKVAGSTTSSIHFDPGYVKTIAGMIKIGEAVVSIIGFICIQTIYLAAYFSAGGWYSFVSMSGFWVSLILLVFYVFHIVERLSWFPWLITETGYAAIWSGFYFIAGCVAAANAKTDAGWGAAAFFGFLAMIIYGYEAVIKYKKWKGGEVAQGENPATTSDTDTGTPSYPTY